MIEYIAVVDPETDTYRPVVVTETELCAMLAACAPEARPCGCGRVWVLSQSEYDELRNRT